MGGKVYDVSIDELLAAVKLGREPDPVRELMERVAPVAGLGARPAIYFVPGRLELLGKHTDYAGGRSLTCAIERGICLSVADRGDRTLSVRDRGRGEEASLDLATVESLAGFDDWRRYPAAVARRLTRDFGSLEGAEVELAADLPPAAGMSSSSALIVASFLALAKVNDRLAGPWGTGDGCRLKLATYLGAVESGASHPVSLPQPRGEGGGGVGTFGGSEDHTAILCSRRSALRCYRYAPIVSERAVRLPAELCFAIAVSGVRASKAGAARDDFNRLSKLASSAASVWRSDSGARHPHLGAAIDAAGRDSVRAAIERVGHREHATRELLERFDHFVEESEALVPAAVQALLAGDLEQFGEIAARSQELAEEKLGNQTPETSHLARSARPCGALASSAFGAGFGGSVWALIERSGADRFLERWRADYARRFPERSEASFLVTRPARAARRILA